MGEELLAHHQSVAVELEALRALIPKVMADYRQRLMERVRQAIADAGVPIQPDHLIREVALFADRTDVSEEVTRLTAHLTHFADLVRKGDEAGTETGIRASGDGSRSEHARFEGRRRRRFATRLRDQSYTGKSPGIGAKRGVADAQSSLAIGRIAFRCRKMDRGPLIVVSGPAGVGKTTVVEELIRRDRFSLRRAVTATTRDPRPGEVDGSSYHFWSRDEFRKAIDDGRMLEWELVFGMDFYGTPRSEVEPHLAVGTGVILVIDVKGAARCAPALSELTPRSSSDHRTSRNWKVDCAAEATYPKSAIQRRLVTAREEMARADEFDHVIINAELNCAVAELERLVETSFTKGANDAR